MLARILTSISICMSLAVAPAIASDWVEDDQLNGFYKHQINKNSGQPDPSYQPVRTAKPKYRTLGPQTSSPSVFDTSNGYGGASSGATGMTGSSSNFASPLTVPATPSQYENNALNNQPKKRGFFGKLGSFGKSVAHMDFLPAFGRWTGVDFYPMATSAEAIL